MSQKLAPFFVLIEILALVNLWCAKWQGGRYEDKKVISILESVSCNKVYQLTRLALQNMKGKKKQPSYAEI